MDDERLDDLVPRQAWTPERHASVARRLLHDRRRAPAFKMRLLGFASIGLAAALIAVFAIPRGHLEREQKSTPAAPMAMKAFGPDQRSTGEGRRVVLEDQSVVTLFGDQTTFRLEHNEPGLVLGRLVGESARFEITHDPNRRFVVEAGSVTVEVLGTIFTVRVHLHSIDVQCERGRVRVSWPGEGRTELTAGSSGSFPTAVAANQSEPTETRGEDPATADRGKQKTTPPPLHRKKGPRSSTRPGRPISANLLSSPPASTGRTTHELLPLQEPAPSSVPTTAKPGLGTTSAPEAPPPAAPAASAVKTITAPPPKPPATAAELMARADRARRDGRFHTATDLLEELLAKYPSNDEAAAAAFTLGRLYLERIKNPLQAANAFFLYRRLSPRGPLAEDALARAAEALDHADRKTEAAQTAREYLDRYPTGTWAPEMARLVHSP